MTVTVNTESHQGYRHTLVVDEKHEFKTDLPVALGGQGSAPDPHDFFDAALGACTALTLKHFAAAKDIPLTGVNVEVVRDNSQERAGHYRLNVKITLKGSLTQEQRQQLLRVADKCPVHKLMTTAEIGIETQLAEGAFTQ